MATTGTTPSEVSCPVPTLAATAQPTPSHPYLVCACVYTAGDNWDGKDGKGNAWACPTGKKQSPIHLIAANKRECLQTLTHSVSCTARCTHPACIPCRSHACLKVSVPPPPASDTDRVCVCLCCAACAAVPTQNDGLQTTWSYEPLKSNGSNIQVCYMRCYALHSAALGFTRVFSVKRCTAVLQCLLARPTCLP